MQKAPYFFSSLSTLALSNKTSLKSLKDLGHVFISNDVNLRDCLEAEREHDAHLVQYKFGRAKTNGVVYSTNFFRLAGESLSLLENVFVECDLLVFDYDFGSEGAKQPWCDEYVANVGKFEAFIRNEHFLSNFIWSPTQHGMRFYAPIVPVKIKEGGDLAQREISPLAWKATYKKIAKCIDSSGLPLGHFDVAVPSNYFATFRMSRVVKPNNYDLRSVPLFGLDLADKVAEFDILDYYTEEEFKGQHKKRTNSEFELYFENEEDKVRFEDGLLSNLYHEPVFTYAREEGIALQYPVWRGLGTSIAASTSSYDSGLVLFDQLSSWGPNYNRGAVEREWKKIWQSKAEGYGPYTYFKLSEALPFIEQLGVPIESSPAGWAFKQARSNGASQGQAPSQPNQALNSGSYSQSHDNFSADYEYEYEYDNREEAWKESHNTAEGIQSTEDELEVALDAEEVKSLLRVKLVGSGENVKEEPKKDILNLEVILTKDEKYYNKLRRNVLGFVNLYDNKELGDEVITWLRTEILRDYGLQFPKADVEDKVKELCNRNLFNPITDYLNSLPDWDDIDRIPILLESLSIYPENENYNLYYIYMKKFLVSAVVRPLQYFDDVNAPNVNLKVDTLLVLQGEQGLKKSTFFETLVPRQNLFSDSLQNLEANPKDAYIHMLNYWIIEFSEFDGLVKRSSQEFLKAFITRKSERFRPPYAKNEITATRPSVLVGTTNAKSFLNDPTGARRYWVITLGEDIQIDVERIAKNRDMLWAQAISMFNSGEQWWLTAEEQLMSNTANEHFSKQDPWEDAVITWVAGNPHHNGSFGFRLSTLFEECLNIDQGKMRSGDSARVKVILESLGLVERRERISFGSDQKRIKVWRRPDPTQNQTP